MTYEYHWSTSDACPIAPVDWVDQVLSFARSVIPAHKIMEGVPLYRYDWTGRSGTPIVVEEAMALSAQRGAPVNWDTSSASPPLEYVAQQERHAVWFENAASVDAKLVLARSHPIGGVTLWRLRGEDPAAWLAPIPIQGRRSQKLERRGGHRVPLSPTTGARDAPALPPPVVPGRCVVDAATAKRRRFLIANQIPSMTLTANRRTTSAPTGATSSRYGQSHCARTQTATAASHTKTKLNNLRPAVMRALLPVFRKPRGLAGIPDPLFQSDEPTVARSLNARFGTNAGAASTARLATGIASPRQ